MTNRWVHEICQCNVELANEVGEFIANVGDVKEESITDYLVWRWRKLDNRFKCIKNVSSFTRHQENTEAGADFEMELWLVGRKKIYATVVFQAKKLIKDTDRYLWKLRYPGNSNEQLEKLVHNSINNYTDKEQVYVE